MLANLSRLSLSANEKSCAGFEEQDAGMKALEAQVQAVTKLLTQAAALQGEAAQLIAEADPPNDWQLEPRQADAEASNHALQPFGLIQPALSRRQSSHATSASCNLQRPYCVPLQSHNDNHWLSHTLDCVQGPSPADFIGHIISLVSTHTPQSLLLFGLWVLQ